MRTKTKFQVLGALMATLFAALLLISCGGGGGGDGGTAGVNPSYTGVTTQATITTANAQELAVAAYQGGAAGQSVIAPMSVGVAPTEINNRLLAFAALTRDLAQTVRPTVSPSGISPQTVVSDTSPGTCGGDVTINVNLNDATGVFEGSLIFSSYCEGGTVLNGTAAFSGQVNTTTQELNYFSLSFQSLTMNDTTSGESATLVGSVGLSVAANSLSATQTIDMVLIDNLNHKSYWVNNYRMDLTMDAANTYTDVSVSGRFYDPDRGYVDVNTEVPLHILAADGDPSSGILVFHGEGNTTARLTVLGGGSLLIEADADGDGTYEWNITYTPV